jgi:hypothetical protein
MRATIALEIGWVGFGFEGGLVPTVKLGCVALWWCRGSVTEVLLGFRYSLSDAARELKRSIRPESL